MNKIYKVIWSKVKHQYVVVSELAHSNGKQSRTAKRSLRSRIAALVVCGAIAAFGFYGSPVAYAGANEGATASESQYVAIGQANKNEQGVKKEQIGGDWWSPKYQYYKMIDGHKYIYTETEAGNFWVRDGYTIKIAHDQRFPGTDQGIDTVVETYKGEGADTEGILQSYQNVESDMGVNTLNGKKLQTTSTDMYVGAVNTPTTEITSSGNRFYIYREGHWENVGQTNFNGNFNYKDVKYDESTGLYTFHSEIVPTENLYCINGNVGVFTTTQNGTEIYKGDVYGHNNEILVTGVDEDGNYVSYWGSENVDPNAPIGSMPMSTLQYKFDVVNDNIEAVAEDNIKQINVGNTDGVVGKTDDGQGGTIGLQTNGKFDADGNPTGGAMIPGGITVTSVANPNEDTKIKFENEKGSFTVNAGSRVEGTTGAASGETLTGLSINGVDYQLGGGKTYTDGDGISISQDDTNTISVNTGNGLKIENDQVVANVDGTTVKTNGQGQLTATTLDEDSSGITATSTYGKDYAVKDTAGNTVTIEDIASASKLGEVDTTVKGHTTTINVLDDRVTTVEGDMITGGSISDSGKITLNQQDKGNIELTGQIHDWTVESGSIDNDGTLTLNTKNQYSKEAGEPITIEGIASTNYVGDQISTSETKITNAYQDYFKINDNYVKSGKVSDDGKQLELTMRDNSVVPIDLEDFASDFSTSDYRLVANPTENSGGIYKPNDNGDIELTVKDIKTGQTETVKLSDIASAETLQTVSNRVGDTQYTSTNYVTAGDSLTTAVGDLDAAIKDAADEAGKHTSVFTNDKNLTVENKAQEGEAANYEVTLNKDLAVNSVTAGGENGTVINGSGLTVAGTQYVSAENGLNAGGKKIQNVAEGVGDKDAVNVSQLKKAIGDIDSYSGWTVTTNGGETDEDKAAVASNGTVDFSADDTNITIDQNGTNLKFGLADDLNVNKITTNNMYVTNVDTTTENNEYSVINRKYFNENEQHINPAEYEVQPDGTVTMTYVDGNGILVKDQTATIKGLTTDADLAAAKTEVVGGTNISVGDPTYDKTDGHAIYTVNLDPVVTLDGNTADGNQIVLDGDNGTISAKNSDTTSSWLSKTKTDNTFDFNENGGTFTTTETTSIGGVIPTGTTEHKATFDGDGATFTKTDDLINTSSTNIDGGVVTVKGEGILGFTNNTTTIDGKEITAGGIKLNSESGDKKDSTIVGLSNITTNYKGFADGSGRAATEEQLETSMAAATTEVKGGTNIASVNKTEGANRQNIYTVNAEGAKVTGDSNFDITSTTDKTTNITDYNVKLKDVVNIGSGENAVTIDGETGKIGVGNNIALDGNSGTAVIGGVNIDTAYDEATGKPSSTITGLSNTTWDGETDDVSRAATEGQLKSVWDKANTAASSHTEVTVNGGIPAGNAPDYSDGNLQLSQKVDEKTGKTTYDVKLNDNITLGEGQNAISLSGDNGTVVLGEGQRTIELDGKNNTITLNKELVIDGDNEIIHGLSNNNWVSDKNYQDENYKNSTTAATEGQLYDVYDASVKYDRYSSDSGYNKDKITLEGTAYNSETGEGGTTITNVAQGVNASDAVNVAQLKEVETLAGKHTTMTAEDIAAPEDGTYTDGNLQLKQTVTDGQIQYDVKLNDNITLGEGQNAISLSGDNGTVVLGEGQRTIELDGKNNTITLNKELVIDGDNEIIHGLRNNNWVSDKNYQDENYKNSTTAATEGQLYDVYNASVKYDRYSSDSGYNKDKITLEGTAYDSETGEGGTTITNLAQGENDSDAVNVAQLKGYVSDNATYTAGDGVNITRNEESKENVVSVNAGAGLGFSEKADVDGTKKLEVKVGDNLEIDPETNKVDLKDDVTLGNYDNTSGTGTGVYIGGTSGTISATNAISVGVTPEGTKGIVIGGDKGDYIVGLDNTEWQNKAEWQNENVVADRAATEGQLQAATNDLADQIANSGWKVSTNDGTPVDVKNGDTVNFSNTDGNIKIGQAGTDLTFNLGDNLVIGMGDDTPNNNVVIDGNNGSILVNAQGVDGKNSVEIDAASGTITGLTGAINDENWSTFMSKNSSIDGTRAATESDLRLVAQHSVQYALNDKDGTPNYDKVVLGNGQSSKYKSDEEDTAKRGGVSLTNVAYATVTDKTSASYDGSAAVNVDLLNDYVGSYVSDNATYTAGDGVNITRNEKTKENVVSVNAGAGLGFSEKADVDGTKKLEVKVGDNLEIDPETNKVDLKDDITLGDAAGANVSISGTNGKIFVSGGDKAITIDGSDQTISGLSNVTFDAEADYSASTKAATEAQLGSLADWTTTQVNNSGWTVTTNGGETDKDKAKVSNNDTVDFSSDGNIVIDQDGTNLKFGLADELNIGDKVILSGTTGDATFGAINISGSTGHITGLTNTTWTGKAEVPDRAATEGQLEQAINDAKTEMSDADRHLATNSGTNPDMDGAKYAPDENGNVTIKEVDGTGKPTGNEVVISDVASASDLGNVADLNDDLLNKDGTDTSVVDAVNNLDDKVGSGDFTGTTHIDEETDNITDAIKDLDSAITDAATEAGKHSTVSDGKNIDVVETKNPNGSTDYKVSLNDDITLGDADGNNVQLSGTNGTISATGNVNAGSFTSGSITINSGNSGTIGGLSNKTWDFSHDYSQSGQAATEAQLHAVSEGSVQYDRNEDGSVNKGSITLGGGEKGTAIHNVAPGEISATSTDAVNGSQLAEVANNSYTAINNVGNQVNRLSNRIDKVGAGAAALAALHPLDFDPDDKLSFAAGYGNYAGENAVAVGAFYQPNEDTMFSVGGTFGNDENMVNAGVSFKLGQKSNVSRSRVSMAKELVSLRDEVAQLKALMAHAGILPSNGQLDTSDMFPDVPENHWAYEYIHELAKLGIVDGYPDGNFEGDRMMTRYEMAAIVYRAMQKGVNVDSRMLSEFEPELKLIRVDVVARDDDGNPTIERVRVNDDTTQA